MNIGQKAPSFKGIDQHGKTISLSDFKGKILALFFYPRDMTPACTVQACNLRDNYTVLMQKGIEVIGISPDDVNSHSTFASRHALPFSLIADTGRKIIERYGVWGEKQLYGRKYMGLLRTTFIIDEKGIITHIFRRPKNKAHAEEILNKLNEVKSE